MITLLASGFNRVPGALSIAVICESLAKIADFYLSRNDDFHMVEAIADGTIRSLVLEMLDIEAIVNSFRKAAELIGTVNEYPERKFPRWKLSV